MQLLDWIVVLLYCVASLWLGLALTKKASSGIESYFVSERRLGWWLAGVPAPALFGVLTSFAALVPFVGTSLVWLPLSAAMYFWKGVNVGLFVLLWGAIAVGLLDNILRPILIGKGAKLPIFLLFLGIFGGMKVYGPLGLLMGPLLISCVTVFLQIYRETKNLPHIPEQR